MKKIYLPLAFLFISIIAFAQNGSKIKVAPGQKIVVENSTEIQASLPMGMELSSNSNSINALEVKNSTDRDITISNTLKKMKVNMNMMGQAGSYDSQNKEGNNEEMAKIFDDRLDKPVDIVVDNRTGTVVSDTKKENKASGGAALPVDDLLKMFSDVSDNGIVSGAFELIPAGKNVGDSWSDSSVTKDMKLVRKFTLKSVNGNEAVIDVEVVSNDVSKLNFQEMEFEVKKQSKTKGEITADPNTGLVSKRTSNAEISGTIQMMGQDTPVSAKTSSTSIYR
ncbi:MAG TPA: DUF6263 family protein [Ferruginibacter sp.]|nr:DUF6263 family protein [Ferruginibacter sp.]